MNSLALVLAALAASARATNYLGFSSGSTMDDDTAKYKSDFLAEFKAAQGLVGAPGDFNAVRLYTNIQADTTNTPIEAFEAAIETSTYILLGIWTSGTTSIQNELDALLSAVDTYGTNFTDLVVGMSIGSEDLYRNSVTGIENDSGVGANPDVILGFISDYQDAVSGTGLADVPVGHVDTWDAWTNSSNSAVIDAVDFLGVDEYPFYQGTENNTITNALTLFDEAYDATVAVAGDKPVWVTETGWPYSGDSWESAVPSVANAKYYWDTVGCKLFGETSVFWYILRDSDSAQSVKFAITEDLSTTARFNLTCPTTTSSSSSSSSTASATGSSSSSASSATATGSSSSNSTSSSGSSSSGSSSSSSSSSGSSSSSSSTGSSTSSGSSSSSSSAVVTSAGVAGRMSSVTALAGLVLAAGVVAFL